MKKLLTAIPLFAVLFVVNVSCAGDRTERIIKLDEFSQIYLKGPFKVILIQSSDHSVRLIGPDDVIDNINVESHNNQLEVDYKFKKWRTKNEIELYISFKKLDYLQIEGVANLSTNQQIKTDNIKLVFDGVGKIRLDVQATKIISEISGVGDFNIEGETDYHKVTFDGIGSYSAINLISKYTTAESNGIGSVKVYASNSFKGQANGIGSIEYYGDPEDVNVKASGIGSINRR